MHIHSNNARSDQKGMHVAQVVGEAASIPMPITAQGIARPSVIAIARCLPIWQPGSCVCGEGGNPQLVLFSYQHSSLGRGDVQWACIHRSSVAHNQNNRVHAALLLTQGAQPWQLCQVHDIFNHVFETLHSINKAPVVHLCCLSACKMCQSSLVQMSSKCWMDGVYRRQTACPSPHAV